MYTQPGTGTERRLADVASDPKRFPCVRPSGLLGLCGENDLRSVIAMSDKGEPRGKLALDMFVYRIRKYIGAYLVALGGNVDAIVFSAGIGENSAIVRQLVCKDLQVRSGVVILPLLHMAGAVQGKGPASTARSCATLCARFCNLLGSENGRGGLRSSGKRMAWQGLCQAASEVDGPPPVAKQQSDSNSC